MTDSVEGRLWDVALIGNHYLVFVLSELCQGYLCSSLPSCYSQWLLLVVN